MKRRRSKKREDQTKAPSVAWAERRFELADWTLSTLAVRTDRYTAYRRRFDGSVAPWTGWESLDRDRLARHFRGGDPGDLIALPVCSRDEVCKTTWVDLDNHGGDDSVAAANFRFALHLEAKARGAGLATRLIDSDGRGGFHLLVVHDPPVAMAVSTGLARWLADGHGAFGLAGPPELFPRKAKLTRKRYGLVVRLPGRHHKRDHWDRVWNPDAGRWLAGGEAVDSLLALRGCCVDLEGLLPPESSAGSLKRGPRRRQPWNSRTDGWAANPREVWRARQALRHLGPEYRDDYRRWLTVGMALRQLGDRGLRLWARWSESSTKYDQADLEATWEGLEPGSACSGVGLGTLFLWATHEGWDAREGHRGPGGRAVFQAGGVVRRTTEHRGEVGR